MKKPIRLYAYWNCDDADVGNHFWETFTDRKTAIECSEGRELFAANLRPLGTFRKKTVFEKVKQRKKKK